MRLDQMPSDDAIVAEMGRRVVVHRVARSLTQDELAGKAGIGRSTVQRIERGNSIQLTSLVKILRVFERLDGLDAVLPADLRSPIAEFQRERDRARRQRVRPDRRPARPDDASGAWVWGSEEHDR